MQLKNLPPSIDEDEIRLLFTDSKKYGEGIAIKNIEKKEDIFIIEFECEDGN